MLTTAPPYQKLSLMTVVGKNRPKKHLCEHNKLEEKTCSEWQSRNNVQTLYKIKNKIK